MDHKEKKSSEFIQDADKNKQNKATIENDKPCNYVDLHWICCVNISHCNKLLHMIRLILLVFLLVCFFVVVVVLVDVAVTLFTAIDIAVSLRDFFSSSSLWIWSSKFCIFCFYFGMHTTFHIDTQNSNQWLLFVNELGRIFVLLSLFFRSPNSPNFSF